MRGVYISHITTPTGEKRLVPRLEDHVGLLCGVSRVDYTVCTNTSLPAADSAARVHQPSVGQANMSIVSIG